MTILSGLDPPDFQVCRGWKLSGRAYYGPPLVVPLLKAWGRGGAPTKAPGFLWTALRQLLHFRYVETASFSPGVMGTGLSREWKN